MLSLLFRTLGAWGAGLGRNLTAAEVDGNFWAIKEAIEDLQDNPPAANGIASIVQVPGSASVTVYEDDGTTTVLTLPTATPIVPVGTITAASYTLLLADRGSDLRCTNVAGCAVTIPSDAELDVPIGSEYYFEQASIGPVVFDNSTDVSLLFKPGFLAETGLIYTEVMLKKVAADTWKLIGELASDSSA